MFLRTYIFEGRGAHISTLRLAVHKHVNAEALLDSNAMCNVGINIVGVLSVINLPSLEGCAGCADGGGLGEATDRGGRESRHLQPTKLSN